MRVPTGNAGMSYWIDTTPPTNLPPLSADLEVDVGILGGGIAGLTTAYLLAKAGRSVALLERGHVALAETGHTTAHLQIVMDTRASVLAQRFGLDGLRRAWDSQREAVSLIESIARDERIECDLERLPAYLHSPKPEDGEALAEELRLARKLGWGADWADPGEVPFKTAVALRYEDQGKFHARKYALGLLDAARRAGAQVFEGTPVIDVEEGERAALQTEGGNTVRASWVVHATNVPLVGSEIVHTRLQPYRTYAIGARVPKGIFQDALYWDTLDPYHYTRVEPGRDHDLVILGGEDHRVGGKEVTEVAWDRLMDHLASVSPDPEPAYQWSGQVMETEDDLPFIGRVPGRRENELMITGDSGTGMTNGTIGALMVAERILGRGTPWDELFDPARVTAEASAAGSWISHNVAAGRALVKGALMRSEIEDVAELARGEGAIVKRGIKPIAVSRLADGSLCAVSGVCTHAGCTVQWNHGEGSWDCPCHGSRFGPRGDVLHGPASEGLAPVDVEELGKAAGKDLRRTQG